MGINCPHEKSSELVPTIFQNVYVVRFRDANTFHVFAFVTGRGGCLEFLDAFVFLRRSVFVVGSLSLRVTPAFPVVLDRENFPATRPGQVRTTAGQAASGA